MGASFFPAGEGEELSIRRTVRTNLSSSGMALLPFWSSTLESSIIGRCCDGAIRSARPGPLASNFLAQKLAHPEGRSQASKGYGQSVKFRLKRRSTPIHVQHRGPHDSRTYSPRINALCRYTLRRASHAHMHFAQHAVSLFRLRRPVPNHPASEACFVMYIVRNKILDSAALLR